MKCLIPIPLCGNAGLSGGLPRTEVECFLADLLERLPAHGDDIVVVSDTPWVCRAADEAGVSGILSKPASSHRSGLYLPWGTHFALSALTEAGGLMADKQIMLVDACGAGVDPDVRREARRLFAAGGAASLVSLAHPEDHPVQVRAYHFLAPMGLAYFDMLTLGVGSWGKLLPLPMSQFGGQTQDVRLELSSDGLMTLKLGRVVQAGEEAMALFALTGVGRIQLLPSWTDGASLYAKLPAKEVTAVLALHLAIDASRRLHASCAVPVLFEGAPWVLGQSNHLYAPTPCVNSSTSRKVLGRQDFPDIVTPSGDLAIVAPARVGALDADIAAGHCIGFVCDREIPPLARLLRLLRGRRSAQPSRIAEAAFRLPKPLFPPSDAEALRKLRAQLAPALEDVDFSTGEVAAFAKGLLDFLYETTLREQAPELLHTGV